MKTLRLPLGLLLATVSAGSAQEAAEASLPPPPAAEAAPLRSAQQLEQLVGPIALYPDALIAIILPAAAAPTDIVLAARHLRDFPNDRSQIEHRAWDDSVKSLTNYADVLQWMDQNLDWTKQLGEAFVAQPADLMQAVQRLRAKAQAAGTLIDTPQQQVIAEAQVIRIVPAQPDVIYVPYYQPEVVFVDRPVFYPQPFITFGVGVRVGSWLAFDCDWRRNTIWVGDRHRPWTGHDWRRPVVPIVSAGYVRSEVRPWRPPPQAVRPPHTVAWTRPVDVVRPSPFGSPVTHSYAPRSSGVTYVDHRRPDTHSLPVQNPQPRSFSSVRSTAVVAPTPDPATPTPVAGLPPPPTSRVHRNVPAPAAPVATATGPTVTSAPTVANNPPPAPRWSRPREVPVRTYEPAPNSAPIVRNAPVYAAPQTNTAVAPPAPAPRTTHIYTRSAPPAAAPSAPVATQSAPAVTAPAPAAAAPAPTSQRSDPERRPGRRNEN